VHVEFFRRPAPTLIAPGAGHFERGMAPGWCSLREVSLPRQAGRAFWRAVSPKGTVGRVRKPSEPSGRRSGLIEEERGGGLALALGAADPRNISDASGEPELWPAEATLTALARFANDG